MSYVYWIHLEEHSDITKEGYIGVTSKSADARLKEHLKHALKSKIILSNALNKYKDRIVIKVLVEGSEEYCYFIENRLRPTEKIGWNTVTGGGKPPVFNKKHSEEAKQKISEASKRTAQSDAHKTYRVRCVGSKRSQQTKNKMSEHAKSLMPWEHSRANKRIWMQANRFFDIYQETPNMGNIALENMLDITKGSLSSLLDKFKKQNWNPIEDPKWVAWIQNQTNKERN